VSKPLIIGIAGGSGSGKSTVARKVAAALSSLSVAFIDMDAPVFVGGPVNPDGVAVLAEFEDPEEAGIVVMNDVGFVAIEEALEERTPDLQRTRVFAGVAGWGPDQLEDELDRDDWIIEPADADAIFTEDPDRLWSEVLRRKGGRYVLVSRMPLDPSLN